MTIPNLVIRSECIEDYFQISEIHALAFDSSMGTAALVDIQRHRRKFDAELSLVAEIDGKIVGHVLFSSYRLRIDGNDTSALALSPIAVMPDFQKQGVGKSLIYEGFRRAINKGYTFSFLIGHPSYYPTFGYQTKMFGKCSIKIQRKDIISTNVDVEERKIQVNDIPELMPMWENWYGHVDLAIIPEHSILDWISVNKKIKSSTFLTNGEIVGYVRYEENNPEKINIFLAKDPHTTLTIISYLNSQISNENIDDLVIPVHPESPITKEMICLPYQSETNAWTAAMIKIFDFTNNSIVKYCNDVASGSRTLGMLLWPVEFDILK